MGEIVISVVEVSILYVYFNLVLGSEKDKRNRRIAGILIVALILSLLNLSGISSTTKVLIMMITDVVFAYTCFDGSSFEKILFGVSFVFMAVISEQIIFRLSSAWGGMDLELLLIPGLRRYIMVGFYDCVNLVGVFVVAALRKNRMMLPVRYQILLVVIVCSGIVAFDKLLDVVIAVQKTALYADVFRLTGFIYGLLLFIFVAMIFIMTRLAHVYQERNEWKEIMLTEKFSVEQFETMKNSVETLKGWKHDMDNHLHTISGLVQNSEYQKAMEYIDRTSGEMKESSNLYQTGNVVWDAIISNKAMRARMEHIQFFCEIHTEILFPFTPSECTSVFGNILDNAIDANIRKTQTDDKWIRLAIKSYNHMLLISLENSSDGKYEEWEGHFKSRKGEGHGIGLKQVERIISRYGGFIQYTPERETFRVLITIPKNQEKNL